MRERAGRYLRGLLGLNGLEIRLDALARGSAFASSKISCLETESVSVREAVNKHLTQVNKIDKHDAAIKGLVLRLERVESAHAELADKVVRAVDGVMENAAWRESKDDLFERIHSAILELTT